MTAENKVTLKRVKQARRILLDVYQEYLPDLSSRYQRALSETRSLLAEIQDDLEEREP